MKQNFEGSSNIELRICRRRNKKAASLQMLVEIALSLYDVLHIASPLRVVLAACKRLASRGSYVKRLAVRMYALV